MKSNWSISMELITICMGGAIIVLGIFYLCGGATLPPALVTGISLAGLCLTLSDYALKMDINGRRFINTEARRRLSILIMHTIAVYGIIVFPNLVSVEQMGKERLEFISTVASVIALGFVILAIGYNNRKAVINNITEQFKLLKDNKENIDELKKEFPELKKELIETKEQLLQRQEEVKQLQLLLDQSQEELEKLKR